VNTPVNSALSNRCKRDLLHKSGINCHDSRLLWRMAPAITGQQPSQAPNPQVHPGTIAVNPPVVR
jgi:hypothetical protein